MFEVRAQDGAAELADIGNDKASGEMWEHVETVRELGNYLVPSSVQLMNWEDFGSLIILCAHTSYTSQQVRGWTESSEDMYN